MSADTDVAAAWVSRWKSSAALDVAVPGGITSDRLTEGRPLASLPERLTPYAELQVTKGKDPEYVSSGDFIDYRKVTVTIFGVGKESLGGVVSAARHVFDSPAPLDFSHAPAVTGHMRTQPLGDTEAPDENRKQGEDLRKAVLEWVVWTHRSAG